MRSLRSVEKSETCSNKFSLHYACGLLIIITHEKQWGKKKELYECALL